MLLADELSTHNMWKIIQKPTPGPNGRDMTPPTFSC